MELESVKNRYEELLTAFSKLRGDYDDAIHECEEYQKLLEILNIKSDEDEANISDLESRNYKFEQ